MSAAERIVEQWPAAPRPWRKGERPLTIVDADGHAVAHLSSTRGKFEPEAVNQRLILDAVNAHDELVSTLRESRDFVSAMRQETLNSHTNPRTGKPEPSDVVDDEDALLARIDAALVKAGSAA